MANGSTGAIIVIGVLAYLGFKSFTDAAAFTRAQAGIRTRTEEVRRENERIAREKPDIAAIIRKVLGPRGETPDRTQVRIHQAALEEEARAAIRRRTEEVRAENQRLAREKQDVADILREFHKRRGEISFIQTHGPSPAEIAEAEAEGRRITAQAELALISRERLGERRRVVARGQETAFFRFGIGGVGPLEETALFRRGPGHGVTRTLPFRRGGGLGGGIVEL